MTALPTPPIRPLTVADYLALPEDSEIRYELQEGALVMSPSSVPRHQHFIGGLYIRVCGQTPQHLMTLMDVDVDLQLAPAVRPGTVRRPDIVVVTRAAYDRVGRDGGVLRASEALLAVEVISPGSRRTDTVLKHSEYADAGIPYYWVVDIDERRVALTACHQAGEFGHHDEPEVTGVFRTDQPFPVELDLDGLV